MLVHEALMRNLRDRRFTPELLAKRLIVRGAERPALDSSPMARPGADLGVDCSLSGTDGKPAAPVKRAMRRGHS